MNEATKLLLLSTFLAVSYLPIAVLSQTTLCQILPDGVTDCSNKGLTYVPRDIPPTTKVL